MKWTPGWRDILPSLLLNHGEPRLVYRANLVVVTIPFLVEDRKRLLFITRLIGSAVDTRETSTRQAKRVRGQQAKSYAFFSLPLNLNLVFPQKTNWTGSGWALLSIHTKNRFLCKQSGVDSLTTSSANRDLLERVIESSLIPRFHFANRLVKARKRSARHEIPCQEGLAPSQPYLLLDIQNKKATLKRFNERLLSLVL